MEMFMVGGAVRDEILGVPSKDIDFAVVLGDADLDSAAHQGFTPFEQMVDMLNIMGFKIFLSTPEHLTVRAQFPKGGGHWADGRSTNGLTADFVLARKEGEYTDGRRPDFVEPGTLEDDLARRDFTVNAIAKAPDGTLIDPFNGQRDIEHKVIRAVGKAADRLSEDSLRAVRAMRFAATKGFRINSELRYAMQMESVLDNIRGSAVSDERIREELNKMLFKDTLASLRIMEEFPALTTAMFSGSVSLEATMKQKGRGK